MSRTDLSAALNGPQAAGFGAPLGLKKPVYWPSPYQRDRDRIIHCKAFRRLAHKTQVFVATSSDHFRSRLTHTLEVGQVARTLARAFALNEDLAEAISLGHDLGHTPFGHAGERALDALLPGGFSHQDQSVRVVTKLAHDGQGLDLSPEVIDGIGKHSKRGGPIFIKGPKCPITPEGELVRASDIIAYLAHDLEDALEAGLISPSLVPAKLKVIFGISAFDRVGVMVEDLIKNSKSVPGGYEFAFSPPMTQAMSDLKAFLYQNVYLHPKLFNQLKFYSQSLEYIFVNLTQNAQFFQDFLLTHLAENNVQAIVDFIAGMTDRFALNFAQRLSNGIPSSKIRDLEFEDLPTMSEY